MKITFEKTKKDSDHLVILYSGNLTNNSPNHLLPEERDIFKSIFERDKKANEVIETFHYKIKNAIKSMTIAKVDVKDEKDKIAKLEAFGGKLLSSFEKKGFNQIVIKFLEIENISLIIEYNVSKNHLISFVYRYRFTTAHS